MAKRALTTAERARRHREKKYHQEVLTAAVAVDVLVMVPRDNLVETLRRPGMGATRRHLMLLAAQLRRYAPASNGPRRPRGPR